MTTTNSGTRIETSIANLQALVAELGFSQYARVATMTGFISFGFINGGRKHVALVVTL